MDEKRIKLELDSGSEDEWTGEGPQVERTGLPGRPRILSKSANTVNGVAKKMTANEIAKSIGKICFRALSSILISLFCLRSSIARSDRPTKTNSESR